MTDRAYLGGSAELNLAEIHQEMSKLLDKQVQNAQKESLKKIFLGFMQAPEKCAMKMKETRKNDAYIKMLFIPKLKAGKNNLRELRVSDCGYNEGTICL